MTTPVTDIADQLTDHGFSSAGQLRPRPAAQIGASPWCIGCETVDRGYVDFAAVEPHLAELGATQVRLQGGWARCEPAADGRYDFAWLDACIDGSLKHGVRPWLQTSYGHPGYPGGGGIGLTQGIPTGERALAAWDRWVQALARRYGDKIFAWEIWNEADHGTDPVPHEDYGRLVLRTASIIRRLIPTARIYTLSMAGRKPAYVEAALGVLAAAGRADLVTAALFHGYPHNPDEGYDSLEPFAAAVHRHAPHAELIQGETGAPSERNELLAMRQFAWSERKQAAWNLRRMLGHHARGYAMNLFQLSDMQYRAEQGAKFDGRNAKGLLHTRVDGSVVGRKPAYTAAQSVFNTLDGMYPLGAERLAAEAAEGVSAFAWRRAGHDAPSLVAWWRDDVPPDLATPEATQVRLALPAMRDPVLLDFFTGRLFKPPADAATLPCFDVPLALAERATLHTQPLQEMT